MRHTRKASASSGNGHVTPRAAGMALPPGALKRVTSALQTQWKRYRKKLRQCQKKFSEEAVHDSRIEARRLLSRVELLGAFVSREQVAKVEECIKHHLDTFDELRDTQVQMRMIAEMLREYPAADRLLDHLHGQERKFTRQSRKRIKKVKSRSLARLICACREQARAQRKKRDPEAANALLLRSVDRAFARAAELKERISPRELKSIHRTRVAFKKFRYMVEALAEDFAAADDPLLERLHEYQTLMGDIQDVQVLLTAADGYFGRKGINAKRAREFRAKLLGRRQKLVRVFLTASNRLYEFWLPPRSAGRYPAVQPAALYAAQIRRQPAPRSKTRHK